MTLVRMGDLKFGSGTTFFDAIDHVLDATAMAPQLDLEAALALLAYDVLDFASVYRGRRLAGMVLVASSRVDIFELPIKRLNQSLPYLKARRRRLGSGQEYSTFSMGLNDL